MIVVIKNCKNCGKEFEAYSSQKYCSIECSELGKKDRQKEWREEHKEKLKQDKIDFYLENKNKIEKILGKICKLCGMGGIILYHKLDGGKHKRLKDNPDIILKSEFIALCYKCHMAVHILAEKPNIDVDLMWKVIKQLNNKWR